VKNSKKRGFTLLEFMVILAIIVILASFSVPAISRYLKFYKYEKYASQLELLVRQGKFLSMTKSINVGVCIKSDTEVQLIGMGTERSGICTGSLIRTLKINSPESSYLKFQGSGFSFDPRGFAIYNGNVCLYNSEENSYFLICVSRFGGIRIERGNGSCKSCSESE